MRGAELHSKPGQAVGRGSADRLEASFPTDRDRREFWTFCGAVFLVFFTSSTTAYLSVLLSSWGLSERTIGEVLSSPLLPSITAVLVSGSLIERYSALTIAKLGALVSLGALMTFQVALPQPLWIGVCRMVLAFGVGLFLPAGMVYAQSKLVGPNMASLVGIYALMLTMPMVVAPAAAEWYFDRFGSTLFFIVLAVPMGVGVAMMTTLTRDPTAHSGPASRESYWSLITLERTAIPNVTVLVVGFMWGFVISFMTLFLRQADCPIGSFFSACMGAVLVARSVLLRVVAGWSRDVLVALGLMAMAGAYCVLATVGLSVWVTVLCGGIFGLGFGVTFPVLSVWVASQFIPERRGRPVALFGAVYQLGNFTTPALAGALSGVASMNAVLLTLGLVGGVTSAVVMASKVARERGGRSGPARTGDVVGKVPERDVSGS